MCGGIRAAHAATSDSRLYFTNRFLYNRRRRRYKTRITQYYFDSFGKLNIILYNRICADGFILLFIFAGEICEM